jgi:hypothetical protein
MSLWSKIRGTVEAAFQLGLGGPQWKRNVGVIEARNSADSAFAVVRVADPVAADDAVTLRKLAIQAINGFRLTGVTLTPVMTADSTTLATIFLTPYTSAQISLFNGVSWVLFNSAEVSLAVTGRTTDRPFDIFAFDTAGTVTLEFADWNTGVTRAVALVRQDGVWCKSGALTRRYLGTCRARSATTFHWVMSGVDLPAKFDLWNVDNRVRVGFQCIASTNTWAYTLATWRQAQGLTAYQVDVVAGLVEERLTTQLRVTSSNSSAAGTLVEREAGLGYDTVSAPSGLVDAASSALAGALTSHGAYLNKLVDLGRHFVAWLEISTAVGVTTWIGDNGALRIQSGISGEWTC